MRCTGFALGMAFALLAVSPTYGAQEFLPLIPEGAMLSIAIRDLGDLKVKGDQFLKDTEWELPMRPSQLADQLLGFLGVQQGLDAHGSIAFIVLSAAQTGLEDNWNGIQNRILVAIPFSDRAKMVGNFGLKSEDLKDDTVTTVKTSHNFGKHVLLHGKHLYLGDYEKSLQVIPKAASVGSSLPDAQRAQLEKSDILVQIGTREWGNEWKNLLKSARDALGADLDAQGREIVEEAIQAMDSLRFGIVAFRVEKGLGVHLLTMFRDNPAPAARKFIERLTASAGSAELKALPDKPILAAQSLHGVGSDTAVLARVLLHQIVSDTVFWNRRTEAQMLLASLTARPTFAGVFSEIWGRLSGSKVAIYPNLGRTELGLVQLVAVLDCDDPVELVREMKQLVGFADPNSFKISGPDAIPENVAQVRQLVSQLGDPKFRMRESATTKLLLIGEPAILFLQQAKSSTDLEIRRRAESIQQKIADAATRARKDLLANTPSPAFQPKLAFLPTSQKGTGYEAEILRLQLPETNAAQATSLRQRFGLEWDRIRLVIEGKQLVVYWGSEEKTLQSVLEQVRAKKPGLASQPSLAAFRKLIDPAHQAEFHVSMRLLRALLEAQDLRQPNQFGKLDEISSMAFSATPQRLQVDLWLPSSEFKVLVKSFGW